MTHPKAMYLHLAVLYRLTLSSWLCRLLSLRPVLPLGYPDWQIERCSPLWFLFVEAKCNQNKPPAVAQLYFVSSHDPWILLTPGKTYGSVFGEQSVDPCSPHQTQTHTGMGKKDTAASFCLVLSHLRAAAARELAWAGA